MIIQINDNSNSIASYLVLRVSFCNFLIYKNKKGSFLLNPPLRHILEDIVKSIDLF